jgi:hypothetical protein
MTVTLHTHGGIEPPASTALTTTNETTVLTGLTTYLKRIEVITIVNSDVSNNCECTLRWVSAAPASTAFWRGDIAAGETKIFDNIPIIVDGKGTVRSISAQAENANDLTVTVITSAQSKQSHDINAG